MNVRRTVTQYQSRTSVYAQILAVILRTGAGNGGGRTVMTEGLSAGWSGNDAVDTLRLEPGEH